MGPRGLVPIDKAELLPIDGRLRGDFTYRIIENLSLSDMALEQSLWTGAILRNCIFKNVSFARSDFAGTRFMDCEFIECNFEPDELRSCVLTRVRFIDCNLAGIQCMSTQLLECHFLRCDMRRCVIRESQFRNCTMEDIPFNRCGVTLNHFSECCFSRVVFADGTILFLLFDGCSFDNCTMNTETIGHTFGLKLADLNGFNLIYLGEDQERPTGQDLLPALLETYEARRWLLGACLLKINFELEPTYVALRQYARTLIDSISLGLRIDWDELTFLCMVLELLNDRDLLPFLGIWELNGAVNSIIAALEREQPEFAALVPTANNLAWRMHRLAIARMTEVAGILKAPEDSGEAMVSITLSRPSANPLQELIPEELIAASGTSRQDFHLIRAWSGSWHELWQLGLAALGAVNLALVLVDTSWERAAKLWKRSEPGRKALRKLRKGAVETDDGAEKALPPEARPAETALASAVDLPTVAAAVERATADLRAITEADREALLRLDIAVRRLALLSDPFVRRLLDYGAPNLQELSILSDRRPSAPAL